AFGEAKVVGQWPWPREIVAELVNEIHRASPKLIVLDVLFAEQDRQASGDGKLAEAISEAGNVVLPVSFNYATPESRPALLNAMHKEFVDNVELTADQMAERLRKADFPNANKDPHFEQYLVLSRREVMREKIDREFELD